MHVSSRKDHKAIERGGLGIFLQSLYPILKVAHFVLMAIYIYIFLYQS